MKRKTHARVHEHIRIVDTQRPHRATDEWWTDKRIFLIHFHIFYYIFWQLMRDVSLFRLLTVCVCVFFIFSFFLIRPYFSCNRNRHLFVMWFIFVVFREASTTTSLISSRLYSSSVYSQYHRISFFFSSFRSVPFRFFFHFNCRSGWKQIRLKIKMSVELAVRLFINCAMYFCSVRSGT